MIERITVTRSGLAALLAFLAIAGALSPTPALATGEHPYLPGESHLEEFEEGCGATTDAFGDLYVAEPLEGTVRIYDPAGEFLTEFLPGETSAVYPCSMAVDKTGAVYLAGFGIPREMKVLKFVPEGDEFPPTSATEYVLDESVGDEGLIVEEGGVSVAVDPQTADIYVAEEGANEVQRLTLPSAAQCTPGTKLVFAWTPTNEVGTTEVACGANPGTIDKALEDLLGADTVNVLSGETSANTHRIEFTGKLRNTDFPVGVLETREVGSGMVLSTSTAQPNVNGAPSKISVYDPDGTPVPGAIGTGVSAAAYYGVDIDASIGRVYAVDAENMRVDIFDPSVSKDTPITTIDGSQNPNFPDGFGDLYQGFLAVDQTTGNFFVNNIGVSSFSEPNKGNGVIAQFTPAGGFVSQIGPTFGENDELEFGSEIAAPIGLALDDGLCSPNRGNVYVAANYENLYAFGPAGPFTPGVPAVTAVDPSQGPTAGGDTVTVIGTELGCADLPGGSVEFGGTDATNVAVNATGTELTATVPAHAEGTVDVTVTTPNGSSTPTAADEYTYFAVPAITSVSPDEGPSGGGNVVTVTGAEFSGADEAGGSVEFDGAPATAVSVNEAGTQLEATAPAHVAGTVDVTVRTPGGTSSTGAASKYAYVDPPTLSSCSPTAGPLSGGSQMTCFGTHLTGASFAFGVGNLASGVAASGDGTEATMSPPLAPGAAPGAVQITASTAGGTAAQTVQYTYAAAPAVTDVSPNRGPLEAGTLVTVTGTGLAGADGPAVAVKFGAVPATDIDVNPAGTELTAVAPAGGEGTVHVTVSTIGGTSNTSAEDEYTYVSPLTLTVVKVGTGSGSVKCDGAPCDSSYPYGSSVSLEATADSGSTFAGFSGGGCSGTGSCAVVFKSRTTVTATFDAVSQKKEEGGGGQTPPPGGGDATSIDVGSAIQVKDGKALLSVSCPGPGSCKGTIKLTAKVKVGKKTKTIVVGTASYDVPAGGSTVVKVKLSPAAKKRLKKGRLKVKVSGATAGGTLTLKPGS